MGRTFLTERGFDSAAAAHFGVGYAPNGWENLVKHLRGRGFTDEELATGGLASRGPARRSSTGSGAGWSGRSVTSPAMWWVSVRANFERTTTGRSI